MGRKGKWLSSVKKALTPESKEKKDQGKQKKKWFGGKQRQADSASAEVENAVTYSPPVRPPSPPPPHPEPEEVKLIESLNETAHDDAVPISTAVSAEPSFLPVDTYEVETHEVVRVPTVNKYAGMSREEVGAIKIQTAFRGHQARRALRALRGLVRLKLLMEGQTVKRQATHTLKCMQTLSRVQSQITSRRIRMSEEKQALQRQLLQKHAKELESWRLGEEWDDSHQSKEQVEANLLSKYEAAMRRERALAYSFSHQQTWKNPSRSANPMFMNPNNPTWGWSWLERWMAAHPWESRNMADRESNNDQSSVKSAGRGISKAEITKSFARYQINSDKLSPVDSEKPNQTTNIHSPSTPRQAASVARKLKSASPRTSFGGADDDSKSMVSVQSDKPRRHSIAGSSVQDDESLGSSPSLPSYMVPTQSAKAKSRFQSPSSAEKNGTQEKEKGSSGPTKKRLSYPPSPAKLKPRAELVKLETNVSAENSIANGEVA